MCGSGLLEDLERLIIVLNRIYRLPSPYVIDYLLLRLKITQKEYESLSESEKYFFVKYPYSTYYVVKDKYGKKIYLAEKRVKIKSVPVLDSQMESNRSKYNRQWKAGAFKLLRLNRKYPKIKPKGRENSKLIREIQDGIYEYMEQ